MLQRRGSSFSNGSESGGKLFLTAREEGKLAKLTSKKKTKTKQNKKQKTKIKTNKQKGFKPLGSLLLFALLQNMQLLIQNLF
jgi:cytochrome b